MTLNCGYDHGFSVREVIEMVKRGLWCDFKVEIAPRRPGYPAQIVAVSGSRPCDAGVDTTIHDLGTIIAHALDREWTLRRDVLLDG